MTKSISSDDGAFTLIHMKHQWPMYCNMCSQCTHHSCLGIYVSVGEAITNITFTYMYFLSLVVKINTCSKWNIHVIRSVNLFHTFSLYSFYKFSNRVSRTILIIIIKHKKFHLSIYNLFQCLKQRGNALDMAVHF